MLGYSALVAFVALAYYYVKVKPRKLPPGPSTGFLGDNRAQVPDVEPWKTFWAWSKQFNGALCLEPLVDEVNDDWTFFCDDQLR